MRAVRLDWLSSLLGASTVYNDPKVALRWLKPQMTLGWPKIALQRAGPGEFGLELALVILAWNLCWLFWPGIGLGDFCLELALVILSCPVGYSHRTFSRAQSFIEPYSPLGPAAVMTNRVFFFGRCRRYDKSSFYFWARPPLRQIGIFFFGPGRR